MLALLPEGFLFHQLIEIFAYRKDNRKCLLSETIYSFANYPKAMGKDIIF